MHLEEGGSTIYLQKKVSSNQSTHQQFRQGNLPRMTPQAKVTAPVQAKVEAKQTSAITGSNELATK
jgi:hypothetical protein